MFTKCSTGKVKGFKISVISSVRVTILCFRDYYKMLEERILKCTNAVIMYFFALHSNIVNYSVLGINNWKLSFCSLSQFVEMNQKLAIHLY